MRRVPFCEYLKLRGRPTGRPGRPPLSVLVFHLRKVFGFVLLCCSQGLIRRVLFRSLNSSVFQSARVPTSGRLALSRLSGSPRFRPAAPPQEAVAAIGPGPGANAAPRSSPIPIAIDVNGTAAVSGIRSLPSSAVWPWRSPSFSRFRYRSCSTPVDPIAPSSCSP